MKTRAIFICLAFASALAFDRTAFFGATAENFNARELVAKVV